MILLLIIPRDFFLGAVNIPALILFIFSLVYMFMTFLEFFIDTEETLTIENAGKTMGQVREITTNKVGSSVSSAKSRFKNMRETLNQVSSDDFNIEEVKNKEEEKLKEISTGEIEEE